MLHIEILEIPDPSRPKVPYANRVLHISVWCANWEIPIEGWMRTDAPPTEVAKLLRELADGIDSRVG